MKNKLDIQKGSNCSQIGIFKWITEVIACWQWLMIGATTQSPVKKIN